jgi:hypothetical protein
MTPVEPWVTALVEDVLGGPPVQIGKTYRHPDDGLITITGGSYWGNHGLSNFWYWTVLETGETHHGYGDQWPEVPQ